MDAPNPFATLLDANSATETSSQVESKNIPQPKTANVLNQKINDLIERIFLITINRTPRKNKQFVFMDDLAASNPTTTLMNVELLEQALFERLLLPKPDDFLIPNNVRNSDTDDVISSNVISYLYQSFERLNSWNHENDTSIRDECQTIEQLILRNASTAIKQPELFEGQSLAEQWLEILRDVNNSYEIKCKFLSKICNEVLADGDDADLISLRTLFSEVFDTCLRSVKISSLITVEKWIKPLMMAFVSDKTNPKLALLLLDYNTPVAQRGQVNGIQYADTLLGQLLCLSIMPKNQNGPYEYYENMADAQSTSLTSSLWDYLKMHLDDLHSLFKGLLVIGGEVRSKTLDWIGNCLHANVARGQIWNAHNPTGMLGASKTVPDSFMLNLCGVLLRLSKPLLRPSLKVLDVDTSYCAVEENERTAKNVHMHGMDKETCLISGDDDQPKRSTTDSYNFVTEVFYMTHKAIDLGYRVCIDRFFQMNREMVRMQNMFPTLESAAEAMSTQMPKFLCLQKLLIEPTNDQLLLQFYEASALWLSQAASRVPDPNDAEREVNAERIQLPLKAAAPKCLRSIPEFILENIVGYLTFIRHFDNQDIDTNTEAQNSLFTMILVFMGDISRVRNPHLRARLAEGLESLLPKKNGHTSFSSKAFLFTQHPHRCRIVESLLSVFVSIEMTGQNVQFEQKFNYRRPMYEIMKYLWNIEEQRNCFGTLAAEAAEQMEAVNPPLFLRFINLLINDAIFLLDESLSNLQQIRTLQQAQDRGEWETLSASERQQNTVNLQHLGMMAKFDNILGRDTIGMLKLLTGEVPELFCHPSMVDRVAAMLNYFLLNLVGPNKSNFKVRHIEGDSSIGAKLKRNYFAFFLRSKTRRNSNSIRPKLLWKSVIFI